MFNILLRLAGLLPSVTYEKLQLSLRHLAAYPPIAFKNSSERLAVATAS